MSWIWIQEIREWYLASLIISEFDRLEYKLIFGEESSAKVGDQIKEPCLKDFIGFARKFGESSNRKLIIIGKRGNVIKIVNG